MPLKKNQNPNHSVLVWNNTKLFEISTEVVSLDIIYFQRGGYSIFGWVKHFMIKNDIAKIFQQNYWAIEIF